jgi:glycosyltransferase involved in cell wall biosynthesis
MTPKRIVITRAASALISDGVNTFIFELGSALIKKGHKVTILSGYGTNKLKNQASDLFDVTEIPQIIFLKKERFKSRAEEVASWTVLGNRILKTLKPDITIMNGVVPCWPQGVKFVVCHGLKTQGSYPISQKLYDQIMYKMVGSLVAVSNSLKKEIESELRLKNVTVIPVGIDTKKFTSLPQEQREQAILQIGTRNVKNPLTSIKALKIISKELPEANLYIAGNSDIQYKINLEGIKDRVHFLGRIPRKELRYLYSKVLAVSVPSSYEAFSYSTLEAFASGTPVVGSDAITSQLLIDGYNGYRIASPYDYGSFASKLLELMLDTDKWKYMSANTKTTALNFDSIRVAETYLKFARIRNID